MKVLLVGSGGREHGSLLTLEELLDHDVAAVRGNGVEPCGELGRRAADEHAFAGREPVGLQHARRLRDGERLGSRDVCGVKHVLREEL